VVSAAWNTGTPYHGLASTHAEVGVITSYKYRKFTEPINLYVFRFTKTFMVVNSKPCVHCINMLSKANPKIKRVYWSNDEGEISSATIDELMSDTTAKITYGERSKNKH
jgi:hypothetical protein